MDGFVDVNNSATVVAWVAAKNPGAVALVPRDDVPCVSMYHAFSELHFSTLYAVPLVAGATRP